ncbi:Abi family protein [Priestia sp. D3YE.R1]|uniref:Abi family protein n=1 Tax=Priestia sp. D3YE.R1 TaxID=3400416 RepID=UPI003B9FE092
MSNNVQTTANEKVNTIDGLMKHLNNHHKIKTQSDQKTKLRNIGYYHGYKAYRFVKKNIPSNRITFTSFDEVIAINTFDMQLKSLLYPQMMFIETALKNYMLEVIVENAGTDSFDEIYDKWLTYYKTFPIRSDNYKKALNKRLGLRNKFYGALSRDFLTGKPVVEHFYHKDEYVPIWAIFEVVSFGEFGTFVGCSHINMKKDISNLLKIHTGFDRDGRMTETIIFALTDLRNALAHNEAIFDARFKRRHIHKSLSDLLENETGVKNIDFKTVVDYLILMIYLQKNMSVPGKEISETVRKFENIREDFRSNISQSIYTKILKPDTRGKLNQLKIFINK